MLFKKDHEYDSTSSIIEDEIKHRIRILSKEMNIVLDENNEEDSKRKTI